MQKDSFVLKTDYDDRMNDLTDDEVGKLIRAIFKYEKYQQDPKLDRLLMNIFNFIKVDLDKNREKYEKNVREIKKALKCVGIKKIQTYTNVQKKFNHVRLIPIMIMNMIVIMIIMIF